MRVRRIAILTAGLLVTAWPGAAEAGGRPLLRVDPQLAAEWTNELVPHGGAVLGVRRAARPAARQDDIVFEGNLPVGVRRDGAVRRFAAPRRSQTVFEMLGIGQAAKPRREAALPAGGRERTADPRRKPFDPQLLPQRVSYESAEKAGTIIIDTNAKFLYRIEGDGTATRYGVGVGRPGFQWAGRHAVTRKAEWPDWTPPSEMVARERAKGKIIPAHMAGGPENPLGARAMYLGSTLYRIHGTDQPWTIGQEVSSGCIRMRNEDVTDLYEHTPVGTRVIVL